jgi:chromosome segregation ATPase
MNLLEYWKEISVTIGFIITFISGRKSRDFKDKTEGAGAIEALQKIYDTYIEHNRNITDDLTKRLTEVEKHNRDLQKSFNDMSISYAVVVGEGKKMEEQYKQLLKEYEKLKIDHDKLKQEFEKLRKAQQQK